MHIVKLRKNGSTWSWYVENPSGGGAGMTAGRSKSGALWAALRNVPAGDQYMITVNGTQEGRTVTRGF